MKAIRIKMTGDTQPHYWTVRHVPRAFNCGGNLAKPCIISGWEYTDHEGCARFSEGNWLALVAALRATAENYGLSATIS